MNLRSLSDKELSSHLRKVQAEVKRREDAKPPRYGTERNPLSDLDRAMLAVVRNNKAPGGFALPKVDLLKRATGMSRADAQAAFTRLRQAEAIYYDLGGYFTSWGDAAIERGWLYSR